MNWKQVQINRAGDVKNITETRINDVTFEMSARPNRKNKEVFIAQISAHFGFAKRTIFVNEAVSSMTEAMSICEEKLNEIENEVSGLVKSQTVDFLVKLI